MILFVRGHEFVEEQETGPDNIWEIDIPLNKYNTRRKIKNLLKREGLKEEIAEMRTKEIVERFSSYMY